MTINKLIEILEDIKNRPECGLDVKVEIVGPDDPDSVGDEVGGVRFVTQHNETKNEAKVFIVVGELEI